MIGVVYCECYPVGATVVLTPDIPGISLSSTVHPGAPWRHDFTPQPPTDHGHGANVTASAPGYLSQTVRVILPAWGRLMRPPENGGGDLPTITLIAGLESLQISGEVFVTATGKPWRWKGSTDFYLAARYDAGEDITPILEQRRAAGANLVRVLGMIDWPWQPFWGPIPSRPNYWASVDGFCTLLASYGLYCEWVVFAGTKQLMPDQAAQFAHWAQTIAAVAHHPHVLIELLNEAGHTSQSIDPAAFARPPAGTLASHGSGLTDAHYVEPVWDYATYHAPRKGPGDARSFTGYDHYEWEAVPYSIGYPVIPEEMMKPQDYGFHVDFARRAGAHCGLNAGGTFHHQPGIDAVLWPPEVDACARAFYGAIG